MQFYGFRAMTTEIQLGAVGDPKFVEEGFKAVTAWIRSCELLEEVNPPLFCRVTRGGKVGTRE